MYIQSVTYLDDASMANFSFDPIRIYNGSFTVYKAELEDVIINTYASILPKFDVITPAISDFWINLTNSNDFAWYLILGFVIVYCIALTLAVVFLDHYYVLRYQKTIDLMG